MGSQSATVNHISPCTPLSSLPCWPQLWLLPSRSHTFMRRSQLSHTFIKKLLLNLMFIRNLHYLQKLLEMLPMLLVQSGPDLVSTTWDNLFHADSESWCHVGKRQIPFIGLASLDS